MMIRRVMIAFSILTLAACLAAEPPYNWRTDKLSALHLANRTESTSATLTKTWYDRVLTDNAMETITGYYLFTTEQPDFNAGIGFASGAESITYNGGNTEFDFTGPLNAATVDTGQGNYELFAMDQNVRTTDDPTFDDPVVDDLQARKIHAPNTGGASLTLQALAADGHITFYDQGSDVRFDFNNADDKIYIGDVEGDFSGNKIVVDWSPAAGEPTLDVQGNTIRITTTRTPSSAADTGTTGSICWDSSFIYCCVGTNTWKRAALSTW